MCVRMKMNAKRGQNIIYLCLSKCLTVLKKKYVFKNHKQMLMRSYRCDLAK